MMLLHLFGEWLAVMLLHLFGEWLGPWCHFPYSISLGSGLGLVSLLLLAGRDLVSGVEHMDGKRLSRVSI